MKLSIPPIFQDLIVLGAGVTLENNLSDENNIVESTIVGGAFVGTYGLMKDVINRSPLELVKDAAAFGLGVGIECSIGTSNPIEAVKTGAAILGAYKLLQHTTSIKPARTPVEIQHTNTNTPKP